MADCELAFKVNEPIVCLSNCTDKVENKAGKTPCSLKFNEVPPVTDKTGDKKLYIIMPFAAISKPLPAPKSSSSHPLLSSLRPQTTNPPEPLPFVDTRLPLIITVSRLVMGASIDCDMLMEETSTFGISLSSIQSFWSVQLHVEILDSLSRWFGEAFDLKQSNLMPNSRKKKQIFRPLAHVEGRLWYGRPEHDSKTLNSKNGPISTFIESYEPACFVYTEHKATPSTFTMLKVGAYAK
uniref:Uncharacterized protein n=1 Tax=Glossina austeni TaxID=7395 RepID=A0A1A9V7Q4_GLOAU